MAEMKAFVYFKPNPLDQYAPGRSSASTGISMVGADSTHPEIQRLEKFSEEYKASFDRFLGIMKKAGAVDISGFMKSPSSGELSLHSEKMNSADIVIALGGDGTILKAAQYVKGPPIIGVNILPGSSRGFLCVSLDQFGEYIHDIANAPKAVLPRIKTILNGKELEELALNDALVTHQLYGGTIKYHITSDRNEAGKVRAKNDGVLVSTANGSTAYMYSLNEGILPYSEKRLFYKQLGQRGEKASLAEIVELDIYEKGATLKLDGLNTIYPLDFLSHITLENTGKELTIIGNLEEKRKTLK